MIECLAEEPSCLGEYDGCMIGDETQQEKEEDKKIKNFHECNWDYLCTMCKNYDDCINEFNDV